MSGQRSERRSGRGKFHPIVDRKNIHLVHVQMYKKQHEMSEK